MGVVPVAPRSRIAPEVYGLTKDDLINALDQTWAEFHSAITDLREYAGAAEIGLQIWRDERSHDGADAEDVDGWEQELWDLHHQLMVSRSVDLFLVFVRDALRDFATWRPHGFLTDDDRVPIRQVFDATDLAALREELLHERVERLSRRGFQEIVDYLQKRLSLEFHFAPDQARGIIDAVAIRNCVVHNGGRVDDQYRVQSGRVDLHLGEYVPLEGWDDLMRLLTSATHEIYRAMAVKAGSKSPQPMSRWFGDD